MDWLRDTLAPKYEEKARELLKDPWAVRDDYINVILNRSPENVQIFFRRHQTRELNESEIINLLKLLELQRHTLLMYTSCGWFFDELSGIETVQVIQYAGRAVQLAQELLGDNVESHFLELLELAKSNVAEHHDGRHIYDKFVRPAMVDLTKVTAHFAVSSLFETYSEQTRIYCYNIGLEDYQTSECGRAKLAIGKTQTTSAITGESAVISFGILHFGDHNVNAGVREYQGDESYQLMLQELTQTFSTADFPAVIRLLDKHFSSSTYSLRDLFYDEQRKVMDNILESAMSDIEAAYYQVYEHYYPPMRFLSELGNPIPKSFHYAAEFILNSGLRKALSSDTLESDRIQNFLEETKTWKVELDTEGLSYLLQQSLERLMTRLIDSPEDMTLLDELLSGAKIAFNVPFSIDLWKVQNNYHNLLQSTYTDLSKRAKLGDVGAQEWVKRFISLGQQLSMRVG